MGLPLHSVSGYFSNFLALGPAFKRFSPSIREDWASHQVEFRRYAKESKGASLHSQGPGCFGFGYSPHPAWKSWEIKNSEY
ncbi:hypothetical protein LEP1GSC047_2373 [Leptospira inadai serovar Lyme str. 10]|uniref:Uncharacterized protein n=1 Tax=Leptospira inadai serovar Lyme str. 10 TaxID=1049790 RepID=V6HDU5_9LEPT|nr:hypothetical protein LEP1GSC047_2373 [Leptospira inadai serovar Lyme str. 10]